MKKIFTDSNLEKRLRNYSSLATAALLVAAPVKASVVTTVHEQTYYFGIITKLDIDGDGNIDVQFHGSSSTIPINFSVAGDFHYLNVFSAIVSSSGATYAAALNASDSIPFTGISWRANDATVTNSSYANFLPGQTHYVAIKFKIGSNWHCGWLKITVNQIELDNATFTLHEYAYETTPNTGISAPLPVELTSFTAIPLINSVKLEWRTATEVNNYGFEVQRAAINQGSSTNFKKIGFVEGAGNSNSPKEYSFVDESVLGGSYLYRLKQIDNDGSYEYSAAIKVTTEPPAKFALHQNYPNPFNPNTVIKFTLPESGHVKLSVFDLLGKEITVLLNEFLEAGNYEQEFSADYLSSGTYIYKLSVDNKYSAEKKMMVLK